MSFPLSSGPLEIQKNMVRLSGFAACLVFLSLLMTGCSVETSYRSSGSGGGGTTYNPLVITTTSPLPVGVVNTPYSDTLMATGGNGSYSWSISSGTLPAGLTLSTAGVISGSPTGAGSSTFTIQVTDSETNPKTATLQATLMVNSTLVITTTSLPSGVQNTAYSTQLAAAGGVPPYTWSLGPNTQLPAGLTFSAAGVLSGTPTQVSNTNPSFVVKDSANSTASATLNLVINAATVSVPDGTYAFVFAGTDLQGSAQDAIAMNGEFTLASGAVTKGFLDENFNSGSPKVEQAITSGTLTNTANGIGSLQLATAGGTYTFALAIPTSAGVGKDAAIRMIAFSDTTGTAMRGSGMLKPSSPDAATSAIKNNFAFLFNGSDLNHHQEALVGSFQTNGVGGITNGAANANEAGANYPFDGLSGSYSIDANGRGSLTLHIGGRDFHFSFYEVTPAEWMVISTDWPTLNAPLVTGRVLQQTGTSSGNLTLPNVGIMQLNGLDTDSTGKIVPDVTAGIVNSNSSGFVEFTFDEYNSAGLKSQQVATTYTLDPTTGRVTPNDPRFEPILFVINPTSAFILVPSDPSADSGIIEEQTGSPFANASFKGNYLGGSWPLTNPGVLNEAGLVSADGAGNITVTTDRSSSSGLVQYQNVTGTYAVDSKGRVQMTVPDGVDRIFYIVSPTKVVYLTSDGGGYLGSFE